MTFLKTIEGLENIEKFYENLKSKYGYDPEWLPIRALLYNILQRRVTNYAIYTHDTNEPLSDIVAICHESTEYSDKIDTDWFFMCPKIPDRNFQEQEIIVAQFLRELYKVRKWETRGVFISFIMEKWQKAVIEAIPNCRLLWPFYYYVASDEMWNRQRSREPEVMEAKRKIVATLPSHLELGYLKPSDTEFITELWPYDDVPDKLEFMRYLVNKFPNTAIRDKDKGDKLVAWRLKYPWGAGAHGYVFPEYRRQNFMGIQDKFEEMRPWDELRWDMITMSSITPENFASQNFNRKRGMKNNGIGCFFAKREPRVAFKLLKYLRKLV